MHERYTPHIGNNSIYEEKKKKKEYRYSYRLIKYGTTKTVRDWNASAWIAH